MARKTKISAAIVNVSLHPHPEGTYEAWLRMLFRRRIAAKIHGDRYGLISMLNTSKANDGFVEGIITTFIKLDDQGTWFNSDALEEATEEQISRIRIPQNLHPNAASFFFYLDIPTHKIYVQTYSKGKTLTAESALRFFSSLANDIDVLKRFPDPKLTLVQDRATLDRLFALPRISEIKITVLRPNPDVFSDDFEQEIEAHMAKVHSRKFTIAYQAESGGSIVPDAEIRQVSEAALTNGNIEVIGRDERGSVKRSSNDHPKIIHDQFDSDEMTEGQAFRRLIPVRNRRDQG